MGVHDIYGLGGAAGGSSEPPEAKEATDSSPQESVGPEVTAASDSGLVKPSATAVAGASIDQLLKSHRPISSAVHFTGSDSDTSAKPKKRPAGKPGWLRRVIGTGAGESTHKPAPAPSASTLEAEPQTALEAPSATEAESAEDGSQARPKSAGLLKVRHWVVGGAALVVVLICALVGGLMTAMRDSPGAPTSSRGPDKPDDTAAAGADGGQTDVPLPLTIDPPVCWTPSNDVENAIKNKEELAFTCTPPWNADGTRIVIHLTGGPYRIAKTRMVAGWDYTGKDNVDQWCQYRTIAIATWRFDDGKGYDQTFDGSREQQSKEIPDEIYASTVTLQITKTTVPKCGTSPTSTSTPPGLGMPGFPGGGWGSINLPGSEPGKPSGGQSSGEPKAFALSFLQILGHKPS